VLKAPNVGGDRIVFDAMHDLKLERFFKVWGDHGEIFTHFLQLQNSVLGNILHISFG
jgi:hypothetical protein